MSKVAVPSPPFENSRFVDSSTKHLKLKEVKKIQFCHMKTRQTRTIFLSIKRLVTIAAKHKHGSKDTYSQSGIDLFCLSDERTSY